MKAKAIIGKFARTLGLTAAALVLLLVGITGLLYSQWAQNLAVKAVTSKLNTPESKLSIESFSLRFPLNIDATGVAMSSYGDTIAAAADLHVRISLLPLLSGKVSVDKLTATDARYRLGAPDSAMFMTIAADSIGLAPACVDIADMDIDLQSGTIRGGRLAMVLSPDTAAPKPAAPPVKMTIRAGDIALDNFAYTMRMLPTIDTLSAHIHHATLNSGIIDMTAQSISLKQFAGTRLNARYIAPDSATAAAAAVEPVAYSDSTATAAPWTIKIDSIAFDRSHALYTTAGVEPLPGLDFTYIEVDSLALKLNDFYNQGTTLRLPIAVKGIERCGVALDVKGNLDIDSTALTFNDFDVATRCGTQLSFNGVMGMGNMATDPSLPLAIDARGKMAPTDLRLMFPAFTPYLATIPSADDILLSVDAKGTPARLDINTLALKLNRCVNLSADGFIGNIMNPQALAGNINLSGNIINVNSIKNKLLDPSTASMLNIPPMNLNGRVGITNGTYAGNLTARTGSGKLALNARWNGDSQRYDAVVNAASFPVQAFMPLLELENVTANASLSGKGYNPFVATTQMHAQVHLAKAAFRGETYSDITAKADLADGLAAVNIDSDNNGADFSIDAQGNLNGKTYSWTARLDGRYIDLYALKLMTEPASLEMNMKAEAVIGPGKNDISAAIKIGDLFFRRSAGTIGLSDVNANFHAADSVVTLDVINRDMTAHFTSPVNLDSLTSSMSRFAATASKQMKAYSIEADTLAQCMPPFTLNIAGKSSNLLNDILAPSKMSARAFKISAEKDSTFSLDGYVKSFDTGSMRLDSVYIDTKQHGNHLHLVAGVENRPGNLDEWHSVALNGRIDANTLALKLKQQNIKGKTGFDLGIAATANAADSTLTLHINPYDPVIGYQQWQANDDNFISYTIPSQHIDANLKMKGAGSSLAIYTEEGPGHNHSSSVQEDLIVKLGDIHISDWIAVNPFAPPVKGDINADLRLNRTDGILTGKGSAGITNFFYGKEAVADMTADFDVAATPSGTIRANADVFVNNIKTMTLSGALNDSTATSPFDLDFAMIRFPLATANPFLPSTVGRLSGMLNGKLKISGSSQKPVFNGTIDFDSTAVKLALTGTQYSFSEKEVNVVDNIVRFDSFAITGCNDNPLTVDGTVNLSDMSNMRLNLNMKADNMMIVNSNRLQKGADIYGRGYISLNANAHGSMRFLNVNADLSLNSGTNVTYVIPDATSALANRSTEDMVKFVNFADSAAVAAVDTMQTSGMAMMLDATLTIQDGSIVNVDLSTDGKNRVQLQSNGTLSYAMTPLDNGRLTGRLNIDKGFVRYTPPFMSEKLFNFIDGSYVAFSGNMMNPTLNVKAVDVIKANVTQNGQNSRLVNFDVSLAVTGTLNRMDVAFDLSTNDDITVANELETMSPEQRANQAMNMLLYNVYTGPGTRGDASMAGNPLFSFLESQINSWAANNIKGIDLSFGIDQYDRTINGSTSSTMSYSYQVSKSLFNDRFKIVVGGNYSTDANADENFSQNLINDISFEYFLNNARTMYVRLFRHTGYESILEGEITQTGVGFVYRRKLRRLGDMFLPAGVVRRRIENENARLQQSQNNSK